VISTSENKLSPFVRAAQAVYEDAAATLSNDRLPDDNQPRELSYPFSEPEVVKGLFDLARQTHKNAGKYDVIIGEDTSGRLPALFMREVITRRRAELGLPRAAMRFVSGRIEEDLPEGFLPPLATPDSRALIVSEYIFTGHSILGVHKAITKSREKARIDIASLGCDGLSTAKRVGGRIKPGELLFYREPSGVLRHLYDNDQTSKAKGVRKKPGPAFAYRPITGAFEGALVGKARQDIKILADRYAATDRRSIYDRIRRQ
jgi:hypothetical protein